MNSSKKISKRTSKSNRHTHKNLKLNKIGGSLTISNIIDNITTKYGNDKGMIVIPEEELVKELGYLKSEKLGGVQKTKKKKDKNALKRPTSVYMLWLNANRQMIKDKHFPIKDGEHCYPEGHVNKGKPLVGRDKVTLIAKKAGELWKSVSEADKKPFQKMFEDASTVYKSSKNK